MLSELITKVTTHRRCSAKIHFDFALRGTNLLSNVLEHQGKSCNTTPGWSLGRTKSVAI